MKYAGSGAPADDLPVKVPVRKIKPNLMSIAMKPYKYVEMTKAEMYEDLRKAVENTK